MIQIGKKQCLNIVSRTDFGVYLGTKEEKVLLPVKQVPADVEIGDALTVFVYRDSQDRLIATTNTPKIELDRIAKLKVAQISQIGAFLDWGLEKDLFLPFKEQTYKVKPGDECLVVLYVDKSSRLCASMRRVYNYLVPADCYEKDSQVSGTVIEINPDYGAYVAIDDKYYGMIPNNELFSKVNIGDRIEGRVVKVRDDGKLMIGLRKKAYLQMDDDSQFVLDEIKKRGGRLPFNDKASPELIRSQFNMSKNEFKRAVGRLFKERKIVINPDSIELTDNN
jgi:hypothetical protein